MKTLARIFCAVLLLAGAVHAQQPVTLSGGNFQLVGGGPVANGTVTLQLSVSDGSATVCATAAVAQVTYIFNLDANGNFVAGAQVTPNGAICPFGTFYTAQVKTSGGALVGAPATWTVGPSAPYTGTLFPSVTVQPVLSILGASSGAFEIIGNSGLPAATNTNLWCAGGFGFPILGKCYVGDGGGWELDFAKRTGSTDTSIFKFKDSGEFDPFLVNSFAYISGTRSDRQFILQNPDFEGSSLIPPPGWSNAFNATLSYETSSPAPGKLQSLKATTTSAGSLFDIQGNNKFSVVAGDIYSLTCMVKSDGTASATCAIDGYDKNGTHVAVFVQPAATTSTSWVQLTASGTVPATVVQAAVTLYNFTSAGISTAWFDQVSVRKLDFPGPIKPTGITMANLLISATAPTISSGFGTSPSVTVNNGTADFRINVGTGGTATNGVIGLQTAANGWDCDCEDRTTFSTTVFKCRQTADTTTSATIANFNSSAAAAAWAASDVLDVKCYAR